MNLTLLRAFLGRSCIAYHGHGSAVAEAAWIASSSGLPLMQPSQIGLSQNHVMLPSPSENAVARWSTLATRIVDQSVLYAL